MRVPVFLALLPIAFATSAAVQQVHPGETTIAETVATLRPGEYVWEPQAAPKGPLLLIVNLKSQRALLFRNGVPIAASTISSGRPGYETPTGIFTVLQKKVEHYSSTYDNAPMPYMQRLTWRGVALHAGHLPGYPASHGCLRLPKGFAKLLYGTTSLGMTVVVTDRPALTRIAPRPDLALLGRAEARLAGSVSWNPERSPTGPVSIVVSGRDKRAVVLRNGVEIGSAPVTIDPPASGSWVYLLTGADRTSARWMRIELGEGDSRSAIAPGEWARFRAPEEFRRAVAAVIAPGTSIVVTADSLQAGARDSAAVVLEEAEEPRR